MIRESRAKFLGTLRLLKADPSEHKTRKHSFCQHHAEDPQHQPGGGPRSLDPSQGNVVTIPTQYLSQSELY